MALPACYDIHLNASCMTVVVPQADLFGSKYVGANHGRMLLASSAASLAGPSLLMWLRSSSERKVMQDLFAQVDPAVFEKAFGVGTDHYQTLVEVG